jgi:UDP-sulfoquinovose synthase
MSRILILGGDGYLGWPTALHFSSLGYEVTVVDNYLRRSLSEKLNLFSLFPVPRLEERAKLWKQKTGQVIKVVIGDLADADTMRSLFNGSATYSWPHNSGFSGLPDTIVHYAEQPSAPFSMMDHDSANLTLLNNLLVTNNLMYAVRDYSSHSHIIKLGTMGEYGTPNIDIEEGWIEIEHKQRKDKFLFPRQASSIYHTTKIMDTDLLWLGVRMWNLRVTDLMQGPVYGISTKETSLDRRLGTHFSYDYVFGTVINRFVSQAVSGYPLTVYGTGEQTRGYLDIRDTIQCVSLAEKHSSKRGELRIFNQMVETFTVNQLAKLVQDAGRELGLNPTIEHLPNPRKEAESHYYNPTYTGLRDLGLQPNLLTVEALIDMYRLVGERKSNINVEAMFKPISW